MAEAPPPEPVPDPTLLRSDAVAGLRALADSLERLPLERAAETVGHLQASLLALQRWVALARAAVEPSTPREPRRKVESIEQAEAAASIFYGRALSNHFALASGVLNFLNTALGAAPEIPLREVSISRKVVTGLLIRIANDLRCVTVSALGGYPLQAAALAATTYEVACAAVVINSDDELARIWVEHDDPTCLPPPFNSVPDMTRKTLALLRPGVGEEELDREVDVAYMAYSQLCMAKHANPLVQSEHGFERRESELAAIVGPYTGPSGERVTAFALEHASTCAIWALAAFIGHHVPRAARGELQPALQKLADRRQALHRLMIERGWDHDPTPGRWKRPSQRRRRSP